MRLGKGRTLLLFLGAWGLLLLAPGNGVLLRAETSVLEQLKTQFNQDKGAYRLVVLVSPTCPQCTSGAGWIQEYILKRNPDPNVKVYAVWYEMIEGDSPTAYPEARGLLPDKRVTHYWDQPKEVGRWYLDAVPTGYAGPIQWDAFYLYNPEAVWEDQPGPPVTWGRTILKDRQKLADAVASLRPAR